MAHFFYSGFRRLSSAGFRLRRRFPPAGRGMLGIATASAILGLDTQQTMIHQLFTLSAAFLLLAALLSLTFRGRFHWQRTLPRFATVGLTTRYTLTIDNLDARIHHNLVLMERLLATPPSPAEWAAAREPGEEKRHWFDRKVGFQRYVWLATYRRGAQLANRPLPPLPPTGTTTVTMTIQPWRRGIIRFDPPRIARPDLLGLIHGFQFPSAAGGEAPSSHRLLVLPKRYPLPAGLKMGGGRHYQIGGVALASGVGESEEFTALRPYRPGDSPRHLHWPSWARVGEPVVKEFQQEYFVRHALVLDTFGPEGDPRFEEAVSIAASFAADLEREDSLLDLLFVGAECHCFTSGRSLAHAEQALEILATVETAKEHSFALLTDFLLSRIGGISSCILILLEWDAPRQELVQRLQNLAIPLLTLLVVPAGTASNTWADSPLHCLEVGKIAEGLASL